MKKIIVSLFVLVLVFCLTACGGKDDKTIVVGATPAPHAEILNSDAVQNYIKSKGYTLEVKVYQDYVTPNKLTIIFFIFIFSFYLLILK